MSVEYLEISYSIRDILGGCDTYSQEELQGRPKDTIYCVALTLIHTCSCTMSHLSALEGRDR
jgi:hypothetical protein